MRASSAISAASSPQPRPWPLPAAIVAWALGTVLLLMIGFWFIPAPQTSIPIGWLVTVVPAAIPFGLVGLVQQLALRHSPGLVSVETAKGWARRTMLGGVTAVLGYVAVLELLGALYGDSPLLRGTGIFRPGGTEVQTATMLAGFALMGAVLGAVQWRPWSGRSALWRIVGWILSGALAWGAAGVVLWYVYERRIGNSTVYFEDMFIGLAATLTAIFWASVVIALGSAAALKSPPVSMVLSSLVCGVFVYLTLTGPVATAYKNYSEPLFTQSEIHPQELLSQYKAEANYLLLMDFSDDNSLLAALMHNTGTPGEAAWKWLREIGPGFVSENKPADPKIILWRVPDWKRVGVIKSGQTSASLEQVSVGSGAGAQLVAEVSPEYDRVYVRRAEDKSLVTTIDFRNPPGPLPNGFSYDAGTLNSSHDYVYVRTPDGKQYKLSPRPAQDWVPWSAENFAISPDGRYVANGYDQECLLWVWTLPAFDANASEGKPTATPQPPQPQPRANAGEPQYLAPFKTLDMKGTYGGDVAPEGVPGGGLFSPDGQYLVTDVHQGDVNTSPNYHSALVVWRTSDWARVLTSTLELGFPTLAFSPDSKTLAVGSDGGTIALYSTSDWRVSRTFRVPPEHTRIAFVPDGTALASASGDDETIRFWRTSDWSELRTQQIEGLCAYCYFHFSPDGRLFTADLTDRSVVNIWRVEDGSIERTFKLPEGTLVGGPIFSRDGSVIKAYAAAGTPDLLASLTAERNLYMWSVVDGQRVDQDPDKGILTGAGENINRNGDTKPLYVLRRTPFPDLRDTGSFGNFAPDRRTVVGTCGEHLLCVWKLPDIAGEQPGGGRPATKVPPAQASATPRSAPGQSPTPTVQSRVTWPPLEPLSGSNLGRVRELNRILSSDWVPALAFVPGVQTTTLAIGTEQKIGFWQGLDVKPERVSRLPAAGHLDPQLVSFSSDGQTVLTGYHSEDDTQHELRLWRVSDGELLRSFVGHTDLVRACAISPDGKTMASGGYDCTIRIWNLGDATTLQKITLPEPSGGNSRCPRIETLAFSPDGTVLAVGAADGIRLWRTSDYSLLRTIPTEYNMNRVVFSPDGKVLAGGEMLGLRLWRVSDGKLLRTLEKNEEHEAVAFSPDGSLLAAGASWRSRKVGAISIWRVSDGKLLRQLEGHTDDVISLAFSLDGKLLASGSTSSSVTGSQDNSVRIWGVR